MVIAAYLHDPLVHLASAGSLALLLGVAGVQKLRNRLAFAQVLQSYGQSLPGLLPAWSAAWLRAGLTYLLPVMELLAAVGVLASLWVPVSAAAAAVLLAMYAAVLAISVRLGNALEDCGCHFGGKPQPPSRALVWRNLLLVVLTLNLLMPMAVRPLVWFDALTMGLLLISVVVIYVLANQLISNHASLRALR